jgi:hypothetical protein
MKRKTIRNKKLKRGGNDRSMSSGRITLHEVQYLRKKNKKGSPTNSTGPRKNQ